MFLLIFIFGVILGSFVGAMSWRVYLFRGNTRKLFQGRSMCEDCKHELSTLDLIPVFSFLLLRGKCRYCGTRIGYFTLFIELFTGFVFLLTYVLWPYGFSAINIFYFSLWLLVIVGFLVSSIYDFRWRELPSVVLYPILFIIVIGLTAYVLYSHNYSIILSRIYGVLISGGIFYLLYQLSDGKWIGGGDVRLGVLIGLIIGGPMNSIFMLFIASVSGLLYSLPFLIKKKLGKTKQIPFGPFLMLACYIIFMFGNHIDSFLKAHYFIY